MKSPRGKETERRFCVPQLLQVAVAFKLGETESMLRVMEPNENSVSVFHLESGKV
jgi:hypothetical protein